MSTFGMARFRSAWIAVVVALGLQIMMSDAVQAAPIATGFWSGLWQFILDGQREMSTAISGAVRRLKAEGSIGAAAALITVSFIYGILHAAGPGHGKFVISAYALASERTARRATLLSFMAAFVQAVSAIVIVGVLALVFKATRMQTRALEAWLETISWGLIAVFGAWLVWRQLRPGGAHAHEHAHAGSVTHDHDGHRHDHAHYHHHHHDHHHNQRHGDAHHHGHTHAAGSHAHDGAACSTCGHEHLPSPSSLDGAWSWRKAWALALSIGIRPCTGAIAVLILAGSIGLFWAGVLSAFAMAIGTAITVSILASVAVGSRELAARMAGGDGVWVGRVQRVAALGGSLLVFLMGITMAIASLQGAGPV
jgi:ABC-type nickel/cobalt efflux system permease component RcnA